MANVLVFAYYSFKDPVFQSAVLPYLKCMNGEDIRFVLITWEQHQYKMTVSEERKEKEALARDNIIWVKMTWNSGRFKLFKKAFDFIRGVVLSLFLIKKYQISKIYSEGFPGAIIGHFLAMIAGKKHIVHTFEPHADYMRDAGVWTTSSWEYRFLKRMEGYVAKYSEFIITATSAYRQQLLRMGYKDNIIVLPSCIDTDFYRFLPEERKRIREQLQIRTKTVVVYLGKIGGMYMDEELFFFFSRVFQMAPEKVYFFLFSNEPNERIKYFLNKFNIPEQKVLLKYLKKEEVPSYLSAADIAFCGIKPIKSRRYSSPIKNGEYWSCGLPVIIPEGISDDYEYVKDNKVLGLPINPLEKYDRDFIMKVLTIDNGKGLGDVRIQRHEFVCRDRSLQAGSAIIKKLLTYR